MVHICFAAVDVPEERNLFFPVWLGTIVDTHEVRWHKVEVPSIEANLGL